ncbi:MAG: CRISPR-associated protein [uncultured Sulfurovum sp.]|uniref:CRISPR-associated protein n=1 Tax=uncultured Sulfurovum sp. TaxID=269237 RepID=A0A6S6UAK3_9BACT|nr:MAG: CRISPR-associated protein [uncultured Sulfurovum sp.]
MVLDFSKPVGDPMVEIGRLGLVEFCGKDRFESFEELQLEVKKLFNIYVFKTSGRIGQVFSSNSKFTHNSTGKDLNNRLKQALELYEELVQESYNGYCISCGKKDNLCSVSKTIFPLTTGNSNANFTSNFSNQFLMCKECMSSLFFAPINMQKTTGRMGFMISNNQEINEFWSEENIDEFNANIVKNNFDSIVDSKINIFENFIYNFMEELQEEELFGDITFYLISNVDKGSEVNVIHISENQMRFINKVAPKFFKTSLPTKAKDEWNYLIYKYSSTDNSGKFRTRKENINGKATVIKFNEDVIDNKNYKSTTRYFNPLISNFIQGKSILFFFKKNSCSWNLTTIYLKEIKGMREERLNVIKKVANNLQLFNDDDKTFYKKIVRPIEMTKSQTEFRENLRILMKKFLSKSDEALFSVDEMVLYILPSGESWYETKDILLIALYEKMSLKEEDIEKFNEGDEDE